MTEPDSKTDKSPVIKALRLLEQIARSREPIALAELSRAIGLPKPSTYHLLRLLERAGFVQQDPLTRRHLVASLLEDIALSALRHGAGHGQRRLLMDQLAHRLQARINLVVLKAGHVLAVEWVHSTAALRVDIDPSQSLPSHCTASGKLLLAFGRRELKAKVLASAPFPARTRNTITSARALVRELDAIHHQQHAEDNEELLAGVNCIAVPIRNLKGDVVAGLAVMAPVASLPLAKLRHHLPDLRAVADQISRGFGREAPSLNASTAGNNADAGNGQAVGLHRRPVRSRGRRPSAPSRRKALDAEKADKDRHP